MSCGEKRKIIEFWRNRFREVVCEDEI
jgi:hypothetical protein